jgi:hypothetical protein
MQTGIRLLTSVCPFTMRKIAFGLLLLVIASSVLAIGGVGIALALENQDAFCAVCHTEPEQTYYEQSTQAVPSTLAAFHAQKQTACIDCHSGSGTFGRGVGLQQGAHDLSAFLSGSYNRPAVTTNPLKDEACLQCHANVMAQTRGGARAMNAHYHAFLQRWQSLDATAAHCTTCHTSHTKGLASLDYMAQGKVALVCDGCHAALSGDDR